MGRVGQKDAPAAPEDVIDNRILEFREKVMEAAYSELLKYLTEHMFGLNPEDRVDIACKIAHMLKELGLI